MLSVDSRSINLKAFLGNTWEWGSQRLWPQLRFPLKTGLVAGVLTVAVTLTLPNEYKSEARILPADQRGSAMGSAAAAAAAATVGVSIPGQESPDAAFVDILNSRSLREVLLLTQFTYNIRTWYFGIEQTRQGNLFEYFQKKNMDLAVKALREKISVNRDLKTKLITITAETESPQLSQQVTKKMVRLLDDFVINKSQTRGGAKAQFSLKRLAEARQEMAEAEGDFLTFLDGNRNFLLSPDPSIRLKGIRLDNELKLRVQILTTLAIAREQALLEEKNDMPILNVLDEGNLPIEKSRPNRASLVVVITLLSTVGCWVLLNWAWISSRFHSSGIAEIPPVQI